MLQVPMKESHVKSLFRMLDLLKVGCCVSMYMGAGAGVHGCGCLCM